LKEHDGINNALDDPLTVSALATVTLNTGLIDLIAQLLALLDAAHRRVWAKPLAPVALKVR